MLAKNLVTIISCQLNLVANYSKEPKMDKLLCFLKKFSLISSLELKASDKLTINDANFAILLRQFKSLQESIPLVMTKSTIHAE